jgi:DNA invertase Pin-like site-specific DNA recombinase
MKIYGYHRTSTTEQHLDRGVAEIQEYCKQNNLTLDEMFTDQQTGKNFNRPDYLVLKRMAREGDTIIISEIDRLGRNKEDTLKELRYFKDNNVRVMILELPTTLMDYSKISKLNSDDCLAKMMMDTINNMLIEMYASLAHAEMLKREKRQREGIEAMKARGEWDEYGRPNIFNSKKDNKVNLKEFIEIYKKWKDEKITAVEAMKYLNMKKSTFYRKVKEYEDKEKGEE